jgi:site-specific recombinase
LYIGLYTMPMPFILSRKKKPVDFIESVNRRSTVIHIGDRKAGLEFLISFFSVIRPSKNKKNPAKNLQSLLQQMADHPILLSNLHNALLSQLVHTDLTSAFTESGIPLANGFWQEFFGRLRHKMIPALQNENDFLYVISRIFNRSDDFKWVEAIPHEQWKHFFENVGLAFSMDDKRILIQLLQSLKILSIQVASLGLEKEVRKHLLTENIDENPFLNQTEMVSKIENAFATENDEALGEVSERLHALAGRGIDSIEYIRQNHSNSGTSIHQTYVLLILGNKLGRVELITDILDGNSQFNSDNFISFFKMLVRNENTKNSIREFLSSSLGYVAYQIAEHKGSKGSHYITTNSREYRKMMWSAMKGGAVTSFIAVFKNLLTAIELPIFWHGFAYSMNYSIGFLMIDATGGTLATKQPAFTASAVASSLDTKGNTYKPNLYNLAITVARVSRSQIASFIGNLLIVFPGAYLLAWLYFLITKTKILEGEKAMAMLESQHPWHSLSLLYACNTGVFLFLSGIIAGYVQNKILYGRIGERLKNHPWWRHGASAAKRRRRSVFIENNAGAIIGNISLGFMLGMSSIVSKILGIPFDIRHITISAGNVSVALYGLGIRNLPVTYLITILCGVLGIGLLNFLVSFSLAFIVAVRSRGVQLRDYPEFLGILGRYFLKKPLDFIRPRRQLSETE